VKEKGRFRGGGRKLCKGDKVFFAGRLVLDEEGEIIGIISAYSERIILVMPVERIERALCLRLLGRRLI